MSSCYSVLSPNYRGTKKYNLLVATRIVVEADFNEYKDVKLTDRTASLICVDRFNRIPVKIDGEDRLLEVKEASYSVLEDDYNVGIIDALISFDIYANSVEEATEKMYRTLDGDVVLNNFTLSDMDTYNMKFDCDILLYEFSHEYLMKEITRYDETQKKYEQFASLKVIVNGCIPKFLEGVDGVCNVPYKFDELLGEKNYKFENLNLSIDGLKKVDYNLLPLSFNILGDGLAEFHFGLKFNNIYGFSPDHASDLFESVFIPKNIKFSNFIFLDEENLITAKLKVTKIIESSIDDLAVEI